MIPVRRLAGPLLALFLPAAANAGPSVPAAPAPSVLAQAAAPKFATVTARSCPIYEVPDESAAVKAKVKRGEIFEVGGVKGQWVKVRTRSGIVGYVIKTDVIPGRKDLGGVPPSGGGGDRVPRSSGGARGGIGSGVTIESRTGLLTRAGLAFAANSYGFEAAGGVKREIGMKTAYAGINADVDYWFMENVGAHFRFASTVGAMTAIMREPINKRVDRIPTNINRLALDVQGRWFFGQDAAPSVVGRLGFHQHEMRIDPVVDGADDPLFLVSNTWRGPVLGVGADVPILGPQLGVRAMANVWPAASLTEGSTKGESQPSGKPKGASGFGVDAGAYYNLNDSLGLDAGIQYESFSGAFSGTGRRFNSDVRNSKITDTYVLFVVNGAYRF